MKKTIYIISVALLTSSSVFAEKAEQGLSGGVGMFVMHQNIKSNFNTDADKTLTSLNNEGKSDTSINAFPIGDVKYQFGEHQVFIGQSDDTFIKGILALEIGYENQVSKDSSIAVSYAPTVVNADVWENPYEINKNREKTDIEGNAFRVKYEYLNVTANIAYYDRDVKKENSPSNLLKRSGDGYFGSLKVILPLFNNTLIEPNIFYRKDLADGKAMAYDGVGGGLTLIQLVGKSTFIVDARYSQSNFDAVNPLFSKTRKDDAFYLNATFEIADIFNLPNLSLVTTSSYMSSDSNIDFYNEEEITVSVGSMYYF